MNRPDVRWEGIPHEQIVTWTRDCLAPAVTERLEARLTLIAKALNDTADEVNAVLQRVDGGEWTGTAATVAAAAMRVLRDFDDTMGHHGTVNTLAAYGQSDNASWAKANVPPVVEVRPTQLPIGQPIDVLNATEDFHDQVKAARDAQERARQVMRTYETMTTDRIAALPPLAPAPQVVVSGAVDVITAGPAPTDDLPRRDRPSGDVDKRGPIAGPGNPPNSGGQDSGGTGPSGNGAGDGGSTTPPRPGGSQLSPATEPTATEPTATVPAGARPPTVLGEPSGGHTPNEGTPRGAGPAPSVPVGRGPVSGQPAHVDRTPVRGPVRTSTRPGSPGIAPVGAGGPGRAEEDKEHQVKYGVPGSAIFEPDHDDGLLHDPFRPGSYVAPASIGDDEDL